MPPRPAVTTWQKGNYSIRFGHWRYILYHDGTEELYDQSSDPMEWTNFAGDPQFERWRAEGETLIAVHIREGAKSLKRTHPYS